jgi:uncharacterized membrane protein
MTGNQIARIGAVILFLGVGFALKFASDEGYFPPEIRLIAAALLSIVLLGLGLKQRSKRRQFSLILQGTAAGIFYITTYIALAMYGLIPPALAFILFVATTILSGTLAVIGNSRPLAMLGMIGGFLAPVLSSRSGGNHIALFTYIAILNLGIFAMCWLRSWRSVNMTGFLFTFLISAGWATRHYHPDLYLSCQLFLALFAVISTSINGIYNVRRAADNPRYLDTAMTFGTPLLYSLLQWKLTAQFEYGTALSSASFGAFHVIVAGILQTRYRERVRALVQCYLTIGLILLTLAVLFTFDRRVSSVIFALEAAALVWSGIQQKRWLTRVLGFLLLPIASALFLSDLSLEVDDISFLNRYFVSIAILTSAFLTTGGLLARAPEKRISYGERALGRILVAIGCLWWTLGGFYEVTRHLSTWLNAFRNLSGSLFGIDDHSCATAMYGLFMTASVYLFHVIFTRWKLPGKAYVTSTLLLVHLLLLLLFVFEGSVEFSDRTVHLLGIPGIFAWPIFFAVLYLLLFRQEREHFDARYPIHHTLGLWMLIFIVTREITLLAGHYTAAGWKQGAIIAIPVAFVFSICLYLQAPNRWPLSRNARIYCAALWAPIACSTISGLLFDITSSCPTSPIPYIPLVNPLDLAQAFAIVGLVMLMKRCHAVGMIESIFVKSTYRAVGGWIFIWATSTFLRTIHHIGDVPWDPDEMFDSSLVQTSLSIFWTIAALCLMLLSHKNRWRLLWKTGALLIALVVVKLFLVDLANQGTVGRIAAFMGVGILLLSIGYFASIPPESEE